MRKSVLKRLISYTRPYWRFIILALFCAVIGVVGSLLVPVFVGDAIDLVLGPGAVDFSGVLRIVIQIAVTIALSAVFQFAMSALTNRITYRTVRDLRVEAFKKINSVPLKYIDGHSHGDVISRMINDIDAVSDGLLQGDVYKRQT